MIRGVNEMPKSDNEHQYCILCGNDELIPLEQYKAAYLCQCLRCNLVFSDQRPSTEEIEVLQKQKKWKDHITEDAFRRYSHILDRFEHFRKNNCILDLDCSHGEFLEMAKERGWEVYGTADTKEALELCRSKGLEMYEGAFNTENFEEERFDVVCMRNVLEHVIDPNEKIKQIRRIVRSGGLVYATTPNFNSFLRFRLKEKYSMISYPLRLVYYTRGPFKRLFKQNDFKVLETEAAGVSFSKRKIVRAKTQIPITEESDFIEWEENGKESKASRFQRRNLSPVFSFLGIGDFLKGWFVKP